MVTQGAWGMILASAKETATRLPPAECAGKTAQAYLHASHVTIAFGAGREVVLAVDKAELSVARGETVCIVGPSGCGKTTLLNAIAGFLPITSGELTLNGMAIQRPGPDRAMVFQQPGLLPWRNVLRNVTYGLQMSGKLRGRAAEARARSLLDLVGLADFAHHYPHKLSGGMQQRVNLARALAVDPELLLLDEPFASVDAQTRETLQHELRRICSHARITALFVTHDIAEAVFLANRVYVFTRRPGRVLREFRIDLPEPRTETRLSPEFLTYVRDVAGALAEGAQGTARSGVA